MLLRLADHNTLRIGHAANHRGLLALSGQDLDRLLGLALVESDHHTDTHVEDVEHLAVRDTTPLLQGTEDGQDLPRALLDLDTLTLVQDTRNVLIETATRGYADTITVLVGVSNEGKVTGLVIKDMHETLGLGQTALTDWQFLAQFLNTSGGVAIGTAGEDAFSGATGSDSADTETYVDGITGATVTSKAIARCINSAVAYVTGADTDSGATSWGG